MMMRAQRPTRVELSSADDWRESRSKLDPRRVARASWGLDVAVAGILPGLACEVVEDEENCSYTLWLWTGDSEASVTYMPGRAIGVRERGPRDLWAEVAEVFARWVSWGLPGRDRFGLTVSPIGQRVRLGYPERVLMPQDA